MHLRMEFDSGVGPTCFDFFLSCPPIIDQFQKKRKQKRVFGQIKQAGA